MAASSVPRVLFVTLSNIGDLILTTPALVALHEAFPDALVDVVADRRSSDLLRHCPFLGNLFHREKADGLPGILRLLRQLRQTRYEASVDLRTDWLPWLVNTKRRSTRRSSGAKAEHSAAQHFQVVAALLDRPTEIPSACVWFGDNDEHRAQTWLVAAPGRRLAVAPGANWPPKCWPAASFVACTNALQDEFDSVVVLGSSADSPAAALLAAQSILPVLDLAGQTSLCEAAALLSSCTAFIGNDSGLGHIAAAMGLPVVTVFGPGRPARYRPWGGRTAVCLAPGMDLAQLDPGAVAWQMRQLLSA